MTISEVSKKYNLTQDTLRYYEKIGILSNVPRNKSGIRNYDENSCRRIEFVKCMRDAGVEIEALLEYMQLFEKGKSTAKRRKEILEEQREKLLEKQKNITVSYSFSFLLLITFNLYFASYSLIPNILSIAFIFFSSACDSSFIQIT